MPIAIAILAAAREVQPPPTDIVTLGELALDGKVRDARGGFAAALVARDNGLRCILPGATAAEAAVLDDANVFAVATLADAIAVALGTSTGSPIPSIESAVQSSPDLGEVRGQLTARRALEVAAAGGHHLLMTGSPGAGKTMLARCLPGILPELTSEESHEVSLVWAAGGRPRSDVTTAPYRSPHHSATLAALIGGGSGIPVPGEVSLAHRGVLFLDELGEFPPHLLDALRQPVEDGSVVVARRGASVRFPTSLQLVAATNPCPCGYAGDRLVACRCTPRAMDRYRRRLSGPFLDRFDIRVHLGRVHPCELDGPQGDPSSVVRARVAAARKRQTARGGINRALSRTLLDAMQWDAGGRTLLGEAVESLALTARGWERVRRVAVTIADLAESDVITRSHMAEALAYRGES